MDGGVMALTFGQIIVKQVEGGWYPTTLIYINGEIRTGFGQPIAVEQPNSYGQIIVKLMAAE